MDASLIPEINSNVIWMSDGDYIKLRTDKAGYMLLNETISIVLKCIDGVFSIQDIMEEVKRNHSFKNSKKDLEKFVEESIELLLEYKIISLYTHKYERWKKHE